MQFLDGVCARCLGLCEVLVIVVGCVCVGVPLLIVLAAIVTDVRSDGGVYVRDDV